MSVLGILYNLLFFIIAIGLLIAFHELGHYWVARRLGVKVLRFSIGFGRPLFTWRRRHGGDEVEFVVAAIPLGGYVKMLDEREGGEIDESIVHRAFNRQPLGIRTAIVVAGPMANFILAVFLYWVVFLVGVAGIKPIVGTPALGTLAEQAGFTAEDEVVSVNGAPTPTWSAFRLALIEEGLNGGNLNILVRDPQQYEIMRVLAIGDYPLLKEDGDAVERLGFQLWQPAIPPIVGGVLEGQSAEQGGLRAGDHVTAIDGVAISDWDQLVEKIKASPGQLLSFEIERDSRRVILNITPLTRQNGNEPEGYIGAYADRPESITERFVTYVSYGPVEAVGEAIVKTVDMSVLTLRVMGKMLVGEASVENISGPLSIAQFAGQTASIGLMTYLSFLAIISVSLGVLNLLPVPMLDGGHLLYYLIEAIKGSPLSEHMQYVGQQIGMVALFLLMSLALFNDLQRLL